MLASVIPCASALAGPFGEPGHPTSTVTAWATAVEEFTAGFLDIAHPGLGRVSFGLPENALGPATSDIYDVVSLGDGGTLTLQFEDGIGDASGDDFAVWENGFFTVGGLFAELAFVEVSSDGIAFARFPAEIVNTIAVGGLDPLDPSDYDNLAGLHPFALGTGLDLRDLASDPLVLSGSVDLTDVQYVRLVDVVGNGSTEDAFGNPVYDPYPTAYPTGGFDVEAVGVLHDAPEPGIGIGLASGTLALAAIRRRRAACRAAR